MEGLEKLEGLDILEGLDGDGEVFLKGIKHGCPRDRDGRAGSSVIEG
jgi:hypothetical protein